MQAAEEAPKAVRFWKLQAAGNDFVLFDRLHEPEERWEALAPLVCDRHMGVGGDGILVVLPSTQADFRMRMFNPDGTEDFCGNGIRCVGRYLQAAGLHQDGSLRLETISGERLLCFGPRAGGYPSIAVNMGAPAWDAAAVPTRAPADPVVDLPLSVAGARLRITSLSTGTTHTVIFRDELPGDTLFLSASPALEHHPWFPERTSVLWCVAQGGGRLLLRIWERGVGETLSCGTGVCAAAAAARRHGLAGDTAHVVCPGGEFDVVQEGEDQWLHGPAEILFEGVLPSTLLQQALAPRTGA